VSGTRFDVLIRNGRIVDGAGNPWFVGDVALAGDRIAAIEPAGAIPVDRAVEVVDASGMVVCPGFIDIQSHSIVPLLRDGRCLSKITQGVTTEIMGEAWTPAPVGGRFTEPFSHAFIGGVAEEWIERAKGWSRFGDWLSALQAHGVSPNVGSFLGAGTLRIYAKGMEMGRPSADELATMRRVMAEAMEDGAFGVAYALIYPPDAYADTDEIVAVCEEAARRGGVYITHIRSEGDRLLEALEEAIEIGRRADLPVEVYHLKACGATNWPKIPLVIERIDRARAEGVDVTADMYPYIASGTGLTAMLPPWSEEGGRLYERLDDPAERARIRQEILHPTGDWEAMGKQSGPERVMPIGFRKDGHKPYVGKRLAEIAALRDQEWVDCLLDLIAAERQNISTIYFEMLEENIPLQLRQPWIKVSTDAGGLDPAWASERGPVHPRAYGTYPRVLGRYVREQQALPLEDAIRKMTSSVAARLNLKGRGLLQPGAFADIVLFDPGTIGDRATFEQPHQLSVGVRDVWVNGVRVLNNAEHTGATPGRFVRPGG
jgi:dihydroorotase/N-acyl-D-amino-acid deacylase